MIVYLYLCGESNHDDFLKITISHVLKELFEVITFIFDTCDMKGKGLKKRVEFNEFN